MAALGSRAPPRHLAPGVDRSPFLVAVGVADPDEVLQVDDRTNVIGNHGHLLANLGSRLTVAGVDLGMFLAQSSDSSLGIFANIAVTAVGRRDAAVAAERFAAGVQDELARYGRADHGANDPHGTVVQACKSRREPGSCR